MKAALTSPVRQHLICAAALLLVLLSAPFPRVQALLHLALVVALAPRAATPWPYALWALAAGWGVEGSSRLVPHMGGTAWADLTLLLLASWSAGRWPVETFRDWLSRLAALTVLHVVLAHIAVGIASGPHLWGWGWLWALLSLPLWGWITWRLVHPAPATPRF